MVAIGVHYKHFMRAGLFMITTNFLLGKSNREKFAILSLADFVMVHMIDDIPEVPGFGLVLEN